MNKKYEKDNLGTRMKGYEKVSSGTLMKRTPVIIRLDGKSFHTFTKKINPTNDPSMINNPFSHKLHKVMINTMADLCSEIQNAKFGYTQSDEISILLTDWSTFQTDQWFGGNIQKIVSVSAALATGYFNYHFAQEFNEGRSYKTNIALFDSRAFNLPKEEVTNNFLWRQNDATRNSVLMLGHYHFSQKQMHGKNNSQVQDMLMLEKGINWNDIDTWKKRGCCYHTAFSNHIDGSELLDEEIPIFSQQRDYIDTYVQ
jgi:tRNA(His) guanylyltransferase